MSQFHTRKEYGFYPIIDSLDWLKKLLDWGVKTVQLRLKDLPQNQVDDVIKQAVILTKNTTVQLVINDYWQAAIEHGASHLHLGQEDLQTADIKAIRAANLSLGISTHSPEELNHALSFQPDYIALGPIFPTTLKKMPWQPQGAARISEWKNQISCPLIAIGGIKLEDAPQLLAAGADAIAVVSDVTAHPQPQQRVSDWLKLLRSKS